MEKFKAYIAIDDTDEIGYFTSTGEICEEIREHVEKSYGQTTSVTRHQLLLHEDIPYTSHNSSMCFTLHASQKEFQELQIFVEEYVLKKSAPSASAGICMGFEKDIVDISALVSYGLDAKKRVLSKERAVATAKEQNLFLKGFHNGGNGIIGALAGVALRLSGNDGRVKGKITLEKELVSVSELLSLGLFDEIRVNDGSALNEKISIIVKEYLKGVCISHKIVLMVEKYGGFYKPLVKENLLDY
ncbi:MAG: hypothetical protein PHX13_07975 [Thiovulaceae bacterium]|nr:hypothetical protein [Sulfurimonadaceae bacterium]